MTVTVDWMVRTGDAAEFRSAVVGTPHPEFPFLVCVGVTVVRALDAHVVARAWYGEGKA